jgi:hypothetical protein
MTRETFYVSMTRGRDSNTCYVATDQTHLEEHQHFPDDEVTVRSILTGVLGHEGAQKSAHETIASEHHSWAGVAQLAAEYETIASVAQHERWVSLVNASGLTGPHAKKVVDADSFGALIAEFRRAEAHHYDVEALLHRVVTARDLGDADDIGAVLRHRLQRATATHSGSGTRRMLPRLIAGLIPEATGEMPAEMRAALEERKRLIEHRVATIAETATKDHEPWTKALGEPPANPRQQQVWFRQVRTVAAYRDRYAITGSAPLGPQAADTNQRLDAARARIALRNAQRLSETPLARTSKRPVKRTQDRSRPTL